LDVSPSQDIPAGDSIGQDYAMFLTMLIPPVGFFGF
jgi:hypothetical protein